MRIQTRREPLSSAFQTAAMVLPARTPKPVLRNVKLEAANGMAVLMATDMEASVRIEVADVQVDVEGSVLLSAVQFGSILRESTDSQLVIETDGINVVVRGERSEFNLPSADPLEYPSVARFEAARYHEVSARLLKELIKRTVYAADAESGRYALGGVLVELEAERITAVATDGRRLAKMEGPAICVGEDLRVESPPIVPTRSMQLIDRALVDSDGEVRIAGRPSDLVVGNARVTISARLLEGRYPRWREVFPQRREAVRLELTAGPVLAAVRQAGIMTNEESRGIHFRFQPGTLVLAALAADVGRSRVELPIPYDGNPIAVSLDHRFVADFLRVLPPEKVFTLEIVDKESAAVFTTDDGYGYVVMPLARESGSAAPAPQAASVA